MRYGRSGSWCAAAGIVAACLAGDLTEARGRSPGAVARRSVQGALNQAGVPNQGNNWNRNAPPYNNAYNRPAAANQQPYNQQPYNQQPYNQPNYPVARTYPAPQTLPAYNTSVPYNYARPTLSTQPTAAATPAAPRPTTVPRTTPTPVQSLAVHQTAAAHLYTQTRAAAWDLYEHYDQSPGYADAYRELHELLGLVKAVSDTARSQSSAAQAGAALTAKLQEAEVLLQILQVQTAQWERDPQAPVSAAGVDLQTQFERISTTLSELMGAYRVRSQDFAAVDDEPATTIKARQ